MTAGEIKCTREIAGCVPLARGLSSTRIAIYVIWKPAVGAIWAPGGQPRVAFDFMIARGKIVEIRVLMEPVRPRQLDLVVLNE